MNQHPGLWAALSRWARRCRAMTAGAPDPQSSEDRDNIITRPATTVSLVGEGSRHVDATDAPPSSPTTPRSAGRQPARLRRPRVSFSRTRAFKAKASADCLALPSIKVAPRPPVCAHSSARPPWPSPSRARASTSSRRRPTPPSFTLGSPFTPRTVSCPAPPLPSPKSVSRRARRRNLVAAARQSHLRPSHHRQSVRGESNRSPMSLVHLPWPYITTGEPPHRRRARV